MTSDSLRFTAAYFRHRRLHRERLAATPWLMARYAVGGLR